MSIAQKQFKGLVCSECETEITYAKCPNCCYENADTLAVIVEAATHHCTENERLGGLCQERENENVHLRDAITGLLAQMGEAGVTNLYLVEGDLLKYRSQTPLGWQIARARDLLAGRKGGV